jgi:hypothetical protein
MLEPFTRPVPGSGDDLHVLGEHISRPVRVRWTGDDDIFLLTIDIGKTANEALDEGSTATRIGTDLGVNSDSQLVRHNHRNSPVLYIVFERPVAGIAFRVFKTSKPVVTA